MQTKPLFLLTLLALAAVVLAACGGGAQGSPNDFTVTGTDEFKFQPATLAVKAGQQVNLTFKNSGAVEHAFAILKHDAELHHVLEEMAGGDHDHVHEELFYEMHEVAGGGTDTETFTAPTEAGDYVIVCLVPGHAEAGMVGTLTVTP